MQSIVSYDIENIRVICWQLEIQFFGALSKHGVLKWMGITIIAIRCEERI